MTFMRSARMVRVARLVVGAVSLAVLLTYVAVPRLFASDAGGDEPLSPAHQGASPFTLYAVDEGALEYADLGDPVPLAPGDAEDGIEPEDYIAATRETQASVDDTLEWADVHNGPDVHAAYSVYTAQAVAEAEYRRAEYEAGLSSIAELGVH